MCGGVGVQYQGTHGDLRTACRYGSLLPSGIEIRGHQPRQQEPPLNEASFPLIALGICCSNRDLNDILSIPYPPSPSASLLENGTLGSESRMERA